MKAPFEHQRPILGIGLFLIAVSCIALTNFCAKLASTEHHVIDILFYRNAIALILCAIWIGTSSGFGILRTQRIGAHIRRGVVGNIGVGCAFAAYALMPMANATVLLFTIPLFVAILSVPILGEHVGPYRWGAIIVGFIGVVIAASPTGDFSLTGILFALGSSITSALITLYIRDLGRTEPPIRTVFYFLLIGTLSTGIFMPFVAKLPNLQMLWPLLAAGILGFCNQSLKTRAYAIAPAALLSPLLYIMLIWAIGLDYFVWGAPPTPTVVLGAAIIIVSNLFLIWRERIKKTAA